MHGSLQVAAWEFRKTIRNRAVLVSTFLFPVLLVVLSLVIPVLVERIGADRVHEIGVVDETRIIFPALEKELADTAYHLRARDDLEAAEEELLAGDLAGVLFLTEEGVGRGVAEYWVRRAEDSPPDTVARALSKAVQETRLEAAGLDPETVLPLTADVALIPQPRAAPERTVGDFAVSMGLAFLLVLATLITGGVVMNSVIAEKTSRTVEIILSSISPRELLLGKVLGYGVLGILQVMVWAAVGLVAATRFLPGIWTALTPAVVATALAYFVLGYLFVSSMYALLGAVLRDLQSSSQVVSWITIIPAVPLFILGFIIQFPDAGWVRAMAHIPPFTAATMLFRTAVTDVPVWEILSTLAVLALADYLLVRLAAKVFQVGMLMYGKSATPREVWRWLRHQEGVRP